MLKMFQSGHELTHVHTEGQVLPHRAAPLLKLCSYFACPADARHQVAMQLLHSEWEYVSTLNQLYDKYKTPPARQMTVEP